MLARFAVENFLSPKDKQVPDRDAVPSCKELLSDNVFKTDSSSLLKSVH